MVLWAPLMSTLKVEHRQHEATVVHLGRELFGNILGQRDADPGYHLIACTGATMGTSVSGGVPLIFRWCISCLGCSEVTLLAGCVLFVSWLRPRFIDEELSGRVNVILGHQVDSE